MHEQHDDPLPPDQLPPDVERQLQSMSAYTGAPSDLWRRAAEQHRREQQQKLWVWVRRPAPALAAACLALLVASVAVRPVGPTRPMTATSRERATPVESYNRSLDDGAVDLASRNGADRYDSKLGPLSVTKDTTDFGSKLKVPAPDAGGSTPSNALHDGNVAAKPAVGAHGEASRIAGGGGAGSGAVGGSIETGARGAGSGAPPRGPGRGDDSLTSHSRTSAKSDEPEPNRRSSPAPASVTAGSELADRISEPPPAPPPPGAARDANAQTPAGAPTDAGTTPPLVAPPEQTANVRLALRDVNTFYYKTVQEMVDLKSGESIPLQQRLRADAKDAADGANVTLRITEDRLPQVLSELRKSGNVQEESLQLVPKEDRLKQIDEVLAEQQQVALKKAETGSDKEGAQLTPAAAGKRAAGKEIDKEKVNKEKSDAPAQRQEEIIDQLVRRRSQIEQGRDYTLLNIVAVPEPASGSTDLPAPAAAAPVVNPGEAAKATDTEDKALTAKRHTEAASAGSMPANQPSMPAAPVPAPTTTPATPIPAPISSSTLRPSAPLPPAPPPPSPALQPGQGAHSGPAPALPTPLTPADNRLSDIAPPPVRQQPANLADARTAPRSQAGVAVAIAALAAAVTGLWWWHRRLAVSEPPPGSPGPRND